MAALRARAELLRTIREFFYRRDVLEVQTACLGTATVTDPAIESVAVPGYGFLQPSPEFQLKRLLAAGAPSLYQMAPVFRSDERGRLHNPEFTMLEWYRVGYSDAELIAEVVELLDLVLGREDYRTVAYADVVLAARERVPSDRVACDLAFSEGLRKLGDERLIVVEFPADQAALARLRPEHPQRAARFEVCVAGVELANGYWELGDHRVLRQRFEADQHLRAERGLFVPDLDEVFLAAMESGLPDCAGVAVGVDRLLMLQMKAQSLDQVMAFPAERA